MPALQPESLLRQRFIDPAALPEQADFQRRLLSFLLVQDGSTTRLCESIAGGSIRLHVLHQAVTAEVPSIVRDSLPGGRFIERLVCLAGHGQAMMDNLSYIALDGLAPDLRRDLEAGGEPIGHLLERMWVRRAFDTDAAATEPLRQQLWVTVGQPDPEATRSYRLVAPQGPLMLITETFRRGMLQTPPPRD